MGAPKNSDPTKLYLSATRVDSYYECTQRYAARYIWKLPDPGNDGSNRGSTCHDILELLLKPRHRKVYDAAIHHQTCKEVPSLWRALVRKARHYGVADEANLDLIDQFMMVALTNEHFGPKGTIESFSEREFNIEINEPDGRRWNARGKIDRTFIVKDQHGLVVTVTDFKSSKQKYEGSKEAFNIQAIVYQIALKILHPEITRRRFRFLFLKHWKDPWQEVEPMSDAQLRGYEYVLTDLQTALETFTLANASDNLAAFNDEYKWLCGREGTKKDGNPMWMCPVRQPREYWVVLNEAGKIVKSADERQVAPLGPGETQEKRSYPGCPAWYNEKGRRRNFQ